MKASISDCGTYRYTLYRKTKSPVRWVKKCLFIMLNPSTADAEKDDPTIRRCLSFAEREGCTDLTVVNLYALRATNPKEMIALLQYSPMEAFGGTDQKKHLLEQIEDHSQMNHLIICAWGKQKGIEGHADRVMKIINENKGTAYCLGKTKEGYPRHPLYVKGDKPLEQYSGHDK